MNHHQSDDDPFIDQLRRQTLAAPPDAWRAEILGAAMDAVTPPPSHGQHIRAIFCTWLWPHPLAYAGLLAAWVAILALRWQTPLPAWRPTTRFPVVVATDSADARGASLLLSAYYVNEDLATHQQFITGDFPKEGQP